MIPGAVSASTRAPLALHAADEALLRRVLGDTHVAVKPSGPELSGYIGALTRAFMRWLTDVFHVRPALAENLTLGIEVFAIAAVGLGLGLLAVAGLRLEGGDVAGALEALWWWLAASVTLNAAIDESWTTRELLVRARRPELLRAGSGLDALMYGRSSPSAADVGACLARFEAEIR